MNRKAIAIFRVVLLSIIFICGCCSAKQSMAAASDDEIEVIRQKYGELEKQAANLQAEVNSLQQEVKDISSKFQEEVFVISSLKGRNGQALPIYRANTNDYSREIGMYIFVSEHKPLKEKLDIVAQKLSEFYFNCLPVEVADIKTDDDGRRIAEIDLKESKENLCLNDVSKYTGPSWATGYFQGSYGGTETSVCLIETFLQRDYKGEWIDGVRFTYNGEPVDKFEHVPNLGGTSFR